jgi:hypothetical protein
MPTRRRRTPVSSVPPAVADRAEALLRGGYTVREVSTTLDLSRWFVKWLRLTRCIPVVRRPDRSRPFSLNPDDTRAKMRAAWTPERKAAMSARMRAAWTLERKAAFKAAFTERTSREQ